MEPTTSSEKNLKKKVVSLSDYKHLKEKNISAESITSYLSVLSFNQLVGEAQQIISELKCSPYDTELNQTSLIILKELKKRIKKENPSFAVNSNEAFKSLLKQF